MQAADVMTRGAFTVTTESSVEDAARLMLSHRISGLPVVDESGALVGMLTEGDLLRRAEIGTERRRSRWVELLLGPGRLARDYVQTHAGRVGAIMTREVVSITPDTPLDAAVALMEKHRVKRLPVLENGRLLGILSRANLLAALVEAAGKTEAAAISDREIRRRLLAEIDKQSWAPRTSLEITVRHGVVVLKGIVTDEREREALRVAAERLPGVTGVRDHLVWIEPISGMVVEQ
ncbi:MAG TPA: CBS domain-containing protein [Stellaceae bacterium]|nr:CBS domain-containing protein [Stellaceae bacterium]